MCKSLRRNRTGGKKVSSKHKKDMENSFKSKCLTLSHKKNKPNLKCPVYIFAFGEYNSKQVNVSDIKIFRAQFMALNLRKVMLNAANIYLFGIILTKCKCIYI